MNRPGVFSFILVKKADAPVFFSYQGESLRWETLIMPRTPIGAINRWGTKYNPQSVAAGPTAEQRATRYGWKQTANDSLDMAARQELDGFPGALTSQYMAQVRRAGRIFRTHNGSVRDQELAALRFKVIVLELDLATWDNLLYFCFGYGSAPAGRIVVDSTSQVVVSQAGDTVVAT